jgi:hypothetical protein
MVKVNGVESLRDGPSRRDRMWLAPYKLNGNTFSYWDQPGLDSLRSMSQYRFTNFYIKAWNGDKYCQLKFHFTMRYNSKDGWSFQWNYGNL